MEVTVPTRLRPSGPSAAFINMVAMKLFVLIGQLFVQIWGERLKCCLQMKGALHYSNDHKVKNDIMFFSPTLSIGESAGDRI